MIVNQLPDRTIYVNGVEYLYFGGTNYLGVTTNVDFQNNLIKNIRKWGTGYGSSRNANVQLSIYDDCEQKTAIFFGFESAICLTSGMLAGRIAVDYLTKSNDLVFHLDGNHPALFNQNSIPLIDNGKLNAVFSFLKLSKIALFSDSYHTSKTEPIDIKTIIDQIPKHIEITLLLDESHSIGIAGENGKGVSSFYNNLNINRIVMTASLGKAFGLTGGIIASDSQFIKNIREEDTFVGASGMNPAFLNTMIDSFDLYLSQMQKLKQNLLFLSQNFRTNNSLLFNQNYPLIYIKDENIQQKLLVNYIVATSFNYPTPDKKLTRLVISSNHTLKDIEKLVDVLNI